MNIKDTLLSLVSYLICGRKLDDDIVACLSSESLADLRALSDLHDVSHMIGAALYDTEIPVADKGNAALLSRDRILAVFRYRRHTDELEQISDVLEKNEIDHVLLKGSVLRDHYPEPWMRTSCDIDVLVKTEDLDRASSVLQKELGYTALAETRHDISLKSPTDVHLELHFTLIEEGTIGSEGDILGAVWDHTKILRGKRFARIMTDELFYFYHIIHMAKHVVAGGCGIKSIIDHWILQNKVPHDPKKRAQILSDSGFEAFEEAITKLSKIWFEGEPMDENSALLEAFILTGGVYGTVENGVSVGVAKTEGRLKYAFRRILPTYSSMKNIYPSLKGRKWLLPLFHVRRWMRIVFCGGLKKATAQFAKSGTISSEEINNTAKLLDHLGLNKS